MASDFRKEKFLVFGHHLHFEPFVNSLTAPQPVGRQPNRLVSIYYNNVQFRYGRTATANVRMILRYWALQCEDTDFAFPGQTTVLVVVE